MSKAIAILSNVRVAGQHGGNPHMTYIPAHIINGKTYSQKLTLSVMRNTGRFDATGKPVTSSYRLTIWNGLADVCAKYLSIGKRLDYVEGDLDSFIKTLYNQDGTVRMDAAGQPIQDIRWGISVRELDLGDDSNKLVMQEIQNGKRGQQWNVQGTPDQIAYRARLDQIKALVYDGQATQFGFARVLVPQGSVVNMEVYQKQLAKKAGQVAPPVQNNAAAYTTDQFVNNVQTVANGQTVVAPQTVATPPVHQVQNAATGPAPLF